MTITAQDFTSLDLDGVPSLESLSGDRARCLWLLWVASSHLKQPAMTAAQMSDAFRDAFGVSLSRQRIQALLDRERQMRTVVQRKVDGKRAYQVMRAGIDEVMDASTDVLFIEPTAALSKVRQVEELLASRTGVARLCDPYVDKRTLDFLAECTGAAELRLLTANISKRTTFERDLKAFRLEHRVLIEVRISQARVLHDRYIIDDSGLLILGTSLNGLGAKQTFVVSAGPDLKDSVLQAFDQVWSISAVV